MVAGGAEVAALAGEGHELCMAAAGALEAGEAGSQVAAARKRLDAGDGCRVERAVGRAVAGFVVGEEIVPVILSGIV